MSIKGLDVSQFQGEIDWEKVKAAGYRFAMLRAGYGYNTIDKQFRRNASECNRIGLPIGAYWFCYAYSPEKAVREADGCMKTIADYRLDYPVCYDIEQASADYVKKQGVSFTPSLARSVVRSFCNRLEEKGWFAMFYTNRNFLDTYLNQSLIRRYAFWTVSTERTAASGSIRAPEKCRASQETRTWISPTSIIRPSSAEPGSTTCPESLPNRTRRQRPSTSPTSSSRGTL